MKKNKDKKLAFLSDKRFILAISLLMAFVVWVVVAGFVNPGTAKPLRNVNIDYMYNEAQYRAHDLMIVTPSKDLYADVQVTGDGSVLGTLGPSSVSVYADYSLVTEGGTYEVPLRTNRIDPGNWSILEYTTITDGHSLDNPYRFVTLTFEEVEVKTIPVTVRADGVTAASGYFTDPPIATPESVTVRGPKSKVDLVSRVVAEVANEEELTERKKYLGVAMTLQNENGDVIDAEAAGISISPDTVEVDVSVLVMESIKLKAEFTGLPQYFDTDWFNERVSLSTDSVQVVGSTTAFESFAETITVGPFDTSQLALSWESEPVTITLPEGSGMRVSDEQRQVTVFFDTTGMVEKTFEVPVTSDDVVNGPTNANITPMESTVTVKLLGPEEQINALLPESITVRIDAFGLSASKSGQQSIPARILVPGANRCIPLGGYSIVCGVELSS